MDKSGPKDQSFDVVEDDNEYDTLELLERLETLREDMEDLGVATLAEVIQRIEGLHRQMDEK
ncbi:MAG TPA: hypothetical protein VKY19_10400 [Ktedonosporobacter sp.]|jgi:hypothetical protein|nr:hypothetical protein [Ktedonosporobacter sp.]